MNPITPPSKKRRFIAAGDLPLLVFLFTNKALEAAQAELVKPPPRVAVSIFDGGYCFQPKIKLGSVKKSSLLRRRAVAR